MLGPAFSNNIALWLESGRASNGVMSSMYIMMCVMDAYVLLD